MRLDSSLKKINIQFSAVIYRYRFYFKTLFAVLFKINIILSKKRRNYYPEKKGIENATYNY